MSDEVQEYLRLLLDLKNPIYFSLFLTLTLLFLIILIHKYIISPLRKKHFLEKKELELKNIKLMALFAELDPNPLIRVDENGVIIHTNDAAKVLGNNISIDGKNISDILTSINFSLAELIKKDQSILLNEKINNRFYSIHFKGISYLNIAQIYFDDLTESKTFEEELQLSRKQLRELSVHLRDTLEDERQRISRELHDSIGQNLHLVRLKLQNSSSANSSKDRDALLNSIEVSINELKEIIYNLKPKILEEMGIGAALKMLIQKISEETGIFGSIDISGNEERYDPKLELTLYRLIQETVSNIIKHSRAKEFNIQLINNKDSLRLLISDDGIGFDIHNISNKKYSSGFGLLNMQERVNTYNGKLKIDSTPGSGTITIIEIPKNG
ncbi:MAG TPA: sensor histidine kinase [Ignavibacteriaceae bacterium]|nr:sensor histidine kinase [Ignavibacteriaceae bacterium]